MLVCRKRTKAHGAANDDATSRRRDGRRKLGEGGPVFLPRRKTSALGQALIASTRPRPTLKE